MPNTRLLRESCVDFVQLDAVAVEFDLAVDAAHVRDVTTRGDSREVASAIHTLALIFVKSFRGKFRAIVIPKRDSFATDQQFTRCLGGAKLALFVNYEDRRVGDGFANQNLSFVGVDLHRCGPDSCLSRTVDVPQLAASIQHGPNQITR